MLALNCTQVALFMREVIPVMRRQKSGNVINVTSIAARHGGGGGAILYAGAKGFVSTVTHGWAKEVVGDGIRVNAVSPGVITTPFHDRYSTAEQLKAMQAMIPMNRLGTADECAGTFLYLASDARQRLRDRAGDRGQRRAVHAVSHAQQRREIGERRKDAVRRRTVPVDGCAGAVDPERREAERLGADRVPAVRRHEADARTAGRRSWSTAS